MLAEAESVTMSDARRRIYREVIEQLHTYRADIGQFIGRSKAADADKANLFTGRDTLTARTTQLVEAAHATGEPAMIDAAGESEVPVLLVRIANWLFPPTQDPKGTASFTVNAVKLRPRSGRWMAGPLGLRARVAPTREALAG
jgi:hypothetical protein